MAITGWLRISGTHTLPCRRGLGVRNDRSERAVFVRARELGSILKHELRGRREWNVYVEGDDCVAWASVVDVLDIAHSNGARKSSLFLSQTGNQAKRILGQDHRGFDLRATAAVGIILTIEEKP